MDVNNNQKLNTNVVIKDKNWFFAIYAVVTMAVYILPAAKLQIPYLIAGSLMLLSLLFISFKNRKWFNYTAVLIIISLCFMVLNMLHGVGIIDAVNDVIRNVRYFIPALWAVYAIRFVGEKQQKFIFWGFMIIAGFILVKTLAALAEDPWIARILAQDQSTSSDEVNQYRLENVGGYQFSYMMGAVTLIATWSIFIGKNGWIKAIGFIAVVVCYYYIIQTMYTTLLLLVTLGIALICVIKVKDPLIKFLVIALFVLAIIFLPSLFKFLSGVVDADSLLSTKFMQIYNAMTGQGIDALGSRPQLIAEALENWSKTPIFGGYYSTHSHSVLFEYLQQSGVVGLIAWLLLYFSAWKLVGVYLKRANVDTTIYNVVSFYLIVLSIFNDTKYAFEITIAVFFITAMFSMLFCKKTKN